MLDIVSKVFFGIIVLEVVWFAGWYVIHLRQVARNEKESRKRTVKATVEEIEKERL